MKSDICWMVPECFWCGAEKSCAAGWREGEAVCSFGWRECFWLFDVAALMPVGTPAALGRLCGTPWRASAGTASRTSWWEPFEHLKHNHERRRKSWAPFQLPFPTLQHPRVFTEGFTVVLWRCLWNPYLIHCAPPPLPAHFLPSSTGNWTARHRVRSDIVGQASTTDKISICTAAPRITHTLVIIATVTMTSLICYSWLDADRRWRIPLLPGQYPQVWSSCTFPPARWKIVNSWGCRLPLMVSDKYKVGEEESRLTLSFSVARTSSFLHKQK